MATKILEFRPYMLSENSFVYDMLQEIPKKEEYNQTNEFYGLSPKEIREKICENIKKEYGIDTKTNENPTILYVFYDNDKPIGFAGIKLKIQKYWVVHSASIWYKIRPTERNKGYGTRLVKKLVKRCNELGITYINASTSIDNIYSQKVLINNAFTKTSEELNTIFFKLQLKEEPIKQSYKPKGRFY